VPRRVFLLLIPLYNLTVAIWNLKDILGAGSYATDPSSLVMMIFSLLSLPVSLLPFFLFRHPSPWFARWIEINILFVWLFFLLSFFLPQY